MPRLLWIAIAVTTLSGPARADQLHKHSGLFIQVAPGVAYLASGTSGGPDENITGFGGTLDLRLGWFLKNTLAVVAHAYGAGARHATVSDPQLGPFVAPRGVPLTTGSTRMIGLGLGALYYFVPGNFFVSGAVDVTNLNLTDGTNALATDTSGIGMALALGREWWVTTHWSLGFTLSFALAVNLGSTGDHSAWITSVPSMGLTSSWSL